MRNPGDFWKAEPLVPPVPSREDDAQQVRWASEAGMKNGYKPLVLGWLHAYRATGLYAMSIVWVELMYGKPAADAVERCITQHIGKVRRRAADRAIAQLSRAKAKDVKEQEEAGDGEDQ